jgi:ATP phosphoribosyltransferase regulatory subunit
VLANDHAGLVDLLEKRREEHGFARGVGRSADEIAERFFEHRALADKGVAERAADTLRSYLAISCPLGEGVECLREFERSRGLDLDAPVAFFARRADAILARSEGAKIEFDANFGRPLDYYTGVVFELRVKGISEPLVGGGRYDRMLEMLGAGSAVPAVGFTMRLDLASRERGR